MPTLDDNVQQTSGGHPDRIAALGATGNSSDDLIAHIMQQEQQRTALQEPTKGPGLLERLLPLLVTGAGAAVGGREGLHAGLGFGTGMQDNQQQAFMMKEQARQGQLTSLEDAMDKQRQRMITLLQTQPDMFIDPDTMQPIVDPRLIGYMATGVLMPINPAVNRQLTRRSKIEDARFDLGKHLFTSADTPELRSTGLDMMAAAYGLPMDDEMKALAMTGNESKLWEKVMMSDRYDTSSVLAAQKWARDTNTSFLDAARMFTPADPNPPTLADATMTALDKYAQALVDRPQYNDATLSLEEKLGFLFPDDAKSRMLLEKHFGEGGISAQAMAKLQESNVGLLTTVAAIAPTGLDSIILRHGEDPNDPHAVSKVATKLSGYGLNAAKAAEREAAVRRTDNLGNGLAARLSGLAVEGAWPNLYQDIAFSLVMELQREHTDARTGVLDEAKYIDAVNALMANPERSRGAVEKALGRGADPEPHDYPNWPKRGE